MGLIKNTVLYTLGNLLVSLSSFILLPVYTKYLSLTDYGIVNSLQILSSLLLIFFTLSFERSLVRVYHDYDSANKREFVGTILITIIVISVIGVFLTFSFRNVVAYFFPKVSFYPFISNTIYYTFALAIIGFTQTYFQVKQQVNNFLIVTIGCFFLTTFLNLYFILIANYGAVGFSKGLLWGSLFTIPICFILLKDQISWKLNLNMIRAAAVFSLPMCLNLFASWVLNLSDRIFISNFFDSTDVALYSISNKLASIVSMAGLAISMAYNPIFYEIANSGNLNSESKIYRYQNVIILGLGCITFFVVIWSDITLKLFFRKEYSQCANSINFLSLAFFIGQISGLLNLMAYQSKKTKLVATIVIISAIINLLCNYFFMPIFGYLTAVMTTLICNILNFILLFYGVKKNYFIPFNWTLIISLLMVILLFIGVSNLVNSMSTVNLIVFKLLITMAVLFYFFIIRQKVINYLKI